MQRASSKDVDMSRRRNAEHADFHAASPSAGFRRVKREAIPRRNALRTLRFLRSLFVVTIVVSGISRPSFAQTAPKQAVIETSAGTVIIDLAPDAAPNQVA